MSSKIVYTHRHILITITILLYAPIVIESSDSLAMYYEWLTSPMSNTSSLFDDMDASLAMLHCNVYCEGTRKMRIVPERCSSSTPLCKPCYCDSQCDMYGDCCPDKHGNVSNKLKTDFECVGSNPDQFKYYITDSYYMMTSCSNVSSASDEEFHPVTSLSTNVTYLNSRIANCNGVTDYEAWNQKPSARNGKILFSPNSEPQIPTRSCEPIFSVPNDDIINTCNVTGLWNGTTFDLDVDLQCQGRLHYPVSGGKMVFKNIYCFLCNRLVPTVSVCDLKQRHFFSDNSLVKFINDQPQCTQSQWYDEVENTCRTILCRQGYILKQGQCEMSKVSLSSVLYHLTATFRTSTGGQLDFKFLEKLVIHNIPDIMETYNITDYQFTVFNFVQESNLRSRIQPTCLPAPCYSDIPSFGLTLNFKVNYSREKFEAQFSEFLKTSWTFSVNDSIYDFEVSYKDLIMMYSVKEGQAYEHFYQDESLKKALSYKLRRHNGTDIQLPFELPACESVELNANEYTVSNESIYLHKVDIAFSKVRVDRMDMFGLIICIDTLKELYIEIVFYKHLLEQAKTIVAMTFSILSLICLTLTFITYCTFQSLLTLPTKNTMCLVVHLFIAQFLLLFQGRASQDELACKVMGVLIHYFWLCVVCWMNVCSYHMFHVFVVDGMKPISTESHLSKLRRYIAYACGAPLLVVMATIVVNIAVSSGSHIGYGYNHSTGHNQCYLSTTLLTGVAFVLPLGVIIIMNSFFFGMSVWTIARVHKKSQAIGNDQSHVHVYIKLSTLTGVFWTLSILAENLHLQVLVFLAIILNASQGVFIFISYVANRRVLNLWKDKLYINKHKLKVSTVTQNTTI